MGTRVSGDCGLPKQERIVTSISEKAENGYFLNGLIPENGTSCPKDPEPVAQKTALSRVERA
jgi:hypothetical protein